MTKSLGSKIQLVGDDLFVTNTKRIKQGIEEGSANSVLVKVNQIGTLMETFEAIETAVQNNYTTVISHRPMRNNCSVIILDSGFYSLKGFH